MHCKACDRVIDSKDEELCGECLRAAKAVFNDDWGDDREDLVDELEELERLEAEEEFKQRWNEW